MKKNINKIINSLLLVLVCFTLSLTIMASEGSAKNYSPNVDKNGANQVFFGDTHLHTSYSFDAGMIGDTLGPEQAYRFAKGHTVTASLGQKARLSRPLDFLVIADHAESLGIAPLLAEASPIALADPVGKELYEKLESGDYLSAYQQFATLRAKGEPPLHRDDIRRPMWNRIIASAEKHNDPGKFTAFIGYEFTSAPKTNNLHRVVIFRDGADKTSKIIPFSGNESFDPEELWDFLQQYETQQSGRVMAIPHNGNLSNGLMFDDTTFDGKKLTADYAARRKKWEPLYEITQIKGDGEAHPLLSPKDEFADYYTWDRGNFGFAKKTADMLPKEYARAALKRGLKYEKKLGVNPFKFGVIGSTDSHTSIASAEENNFFSKATPGEPNSGQFRYDAPIIQKYPGRDVDVRIYSYESAASGLAAVWARENTREAIFDAMAKREVYATTGSRIKLRVFSGWKFKSSDTDSPNLSEIGYQLGVPMGSNLSSPNSKEDAPKFLIQALRDPEGANLDRIQVVKGWLDSENNLHEKVYDVAWSGNRKVDKDGNINAIGSTVDQANYNNSIGAAELTVYWQDPDFSQQQSAFYYVRVLEIPTPTWLAHDKSFYGDAIKLPDDALMMHQERAYSSPIWYSPK